jgi:ABC-2 type transport system ATP-binding protein
MSDADSEAVTTANDDIVIAAQGLTKRCRGVSVVDAVNVDIPRGEVFGLLGPNGAGKTTTILMMLGLTDISAGKVSVLGYDPARFPMRVKRRSAICPTPSASMITSPPPRTFLIPRS